jgi:hypothetical protein
MRIEGPNTPASQATQRKTGTSSARSGFKVETSGGGQQAERVAESQPLAGVDTLVVLQEAPDQGAGRRRAIKRAADMLDMLEGIRLDLLGGEVPAERLGALLRLVQLRRDQVDDPRLSHLLDEIELRARVELTKLGRAC